LQSPPNHEIILVVGSRYYKQGMGYVNPDNRYG